MLWQIRIVFRKYRDNFGFRGTFIQLSFSFNKDATSSNRLAGWGYTIYKLPKLFTYDRFR